MTFTQRLSRSLPYIAITVALANLGFVLWVHQGAPELRPGAQRNFQHPSVSVGMDPFLLMRGIPSSTPTAPGAVIGLPPGSPVGAGLGVPLAMGALLYNPCEPAQPEPEFDPDDPRRVRHLHVCSVDVLTRGAE